MKIYNAIMIASMVQLSFGEDLPAIADSRTSLRTASGVENSSASELLAAIESHSVEKTRKIMETLVKTNHTRLVIITLYDKSEEVMQEAAKALAISKNKSTALSLLDAARYLDLAVVGGTEAEGMRKRTKKIFDESLSVITGVIVKPEWSEEEKTIAFRQAAEKMRE